MLVDLRKVSHFEVQDHVVHAWVGGEAMRTLWTSLNEVEAAFPKGGLLRIQRDTLVRVESIVGIKPLWNGQTSIRLREGIELHASRGATPRLKQLFGMRTRR